MTRRTVLSLPLVPPVLALSGRRWRLAIAGDEGHINEVLAPLPKLPQVELVGYSHALAANRKAWATKPAMQKVSMFASCDEMLRQTRPDIVAITGHNGEREAGILAAFAAGCHVVAEKPLSILTNGKAGGTRRVRDAWKQSGKQLLLLLPLRFSPPFLAMRDIVRSGAIGEVVQISSQKSYKAGLSTEWKNQQTTYGSTIEWIAPHMVDLMRFCSGREIRSVSARQRTVGRSDMGTRENVVAMLFELDNGGFAELHMDYQRPDSAPTHEDDRLRLAGTRGILEYQAATGLTLMADGKPPSVIQTLPSRRSLFVEFMEHLEGKGPLPVSAQDIFTLNQVIETATLSAYSRPDFRIIEIH
jgi:predicted dehydrogenase